MPVAGFRDAVLAFPSGLEAPADARVLPLVVATHGAGGDPGWTCVAWARRLRAPALVLCPCGRQISAVEEHGFYYPDHFALEKEVLAVTAALEQWLGGPAKSPALYTGYSQGATMGALFLVEHGARFPTLVLTEGGYREWSRARARKFRESGGRRVLFVCGIKSCAEHARRSAELLRNAGVEARVEHVAGGGHTDGGSVADRLDALLDWVFPPS